ncbi:MAG: ComEC/Rec2 family competence protein [Paracoccaceae bacterium]|nr:ComEC/Rec2 family competence protein [Paracoccaceae bacterium]
MRPRRLWLLVEDQRGYLFPWLAVFYAGGVGAFFSLPADPSGAIWAGVVFSAAGLGALGLTRWRGGLVPMALLFGLLGFLAAGHRTAAVAEPVLGFRYYGPVEGRIVGIDRSASDKLRLTLDRVVLADMPPHRTPARVRVSLHGDQRYLVAEPGRIVGLTGHLSPPQGPVEPGGFDFRRQAWFKKLGAVGYTRSPAVTLAPAEGGSALWLWRLRMTISAEIRAVLPGATGGVAAALTVGDRSGIPAEVLEDLRAANLAHLLAISGLHMGLLTGFVFACMRTGLALLPALSLRVDAKKIAAIVALGAGAVYLGLSGGNVATERAFIMVAVMLVAVLFDRRALTLRSVALAALLVLTLRPEALMGPGFQMSFAATTALVAVFGWLRAAGEGRRRLPRWARGTAALVISSAVAGAATAPIAAAHFNQVPHYGLLANLLSVPLMGAVVMPAAVLAAVLAPLGLHAAGLWIMDPPIRWILGVAERVAGLDGALSFVPAPPPAVLVVFALGALFAILWRDRSRILGVAPMVLALVLWSGADRPPVIVAASGGLVGVMTGDGRALSKPRGDGFAARSWLENDGDPSAQAEAAERPGFTGPPGAREFRLGRLRAVHLTGRGAGARVPGACAAADIVIYSGETDPPAGCRLIDRRLLRETGALALWPEGAGLRIVTAAEQAGRRVWNGAERSGRALALFGTARAAPGAGQAGQ